MKKIIIVLLLLIVNCQLSICQIGTWRNYLAYHDVQEIQSAGDDIFVLASNGGEWPQRHLYHPYPLVS